MGACGLQAGLNPLTGLNPLASDWAEGENAAPPGVIPDPNPGDQASAYPGVCP